MINLDNITNENNKKQWKMAIYTWSSIENFADIDYQDFIKIHRECTQQPYNFLTIDTTLPASNPLGFRKDLFDPL